jgi:hypothetical protein
MCSLQVINLFYVYQLQGRYNILNIILFVCLFKDDINNSDYKGLASNGTMTSELRIANKKGRKM